MERTVTTLLYDGKYDGPQMSILVGEGCQMYVISRTDLKFISSHDEMKKPALYVLIGSESGSPAAYIGQTDDFSHRIKDHDYKKPFWTIALAFMREGNPLTSNDVKYLEFLGYEAATKAGNYSTEENKQNIRKPTLRPWDEAPIRSFLKIAGFWLTSVAIMSLLKLKLLSLILIQFLLISCLHCNVSQQWQKAMWRVKDLL